MYVEGAAVVISGYPALLAGVVLRKAARDGAFDRVEPGVRAELLALISEVEKAGRAAVLPAAGSDQAPGPEIAPRSELSAEEAGAVVGVSARRVRQLAPLLGGRKAGGRWVFDRDAVAAEARRRKGA